MTLTLERPTVDVRSGGGGGLPARRAVVRWAWRLFRREWRQQLLVLLLIVVAVGATLVGAAVATDTPPAADAAFGTAQDMATLPVSPGNAGGKAGAVSHVQAEIAAIAHRFGRVDVIENEQITVPGSITTFDLRSQDPHGPFGQPLLSLTGGRYPTGPGQVAVSALVASTFGLHVGSTWHIAGRTYSVVGTVQNPESLLDEFALVAPGQVPAPTTATVLFDAHGFNVSSLGPNFESVSDVEKAQSNSFNPETIVLALATIGMLLIALVAVGGFTVLAQRRLRSIGMLGSIGATDRHLRLVVRANGVVVGVVGAVVGVLAGLLVWLLYRPTVEADAHHVIGAFAIPWIVVGPAAVLAVLATYFAASRPARAMARVPIVSALSGRPAPPKEVHRSALPGVICILVAVILLGVSGSATGGGGAPELVFGLVALVVALVLLAPMCLAVLGLVGRHAPVAVRLAVRDLARYRARSSSALAAISIGVLIAVIVAVTAAARYGNVLDYAGPNLASDQVIVYTPYGNGNGGPGGTVSARQLGQMKRTADGIAAQLGSHDLVELDMTSANLNHNGTGRNWTGAVYLATPQLLAAFGIPASSVQPDADVLSMRPGLSTTSGMQIQFSNGQSKQVGPGPQSGPVSGPGNPSGATRSPCPPASCISNPVIQEVSALPSGTSAPNTVFTEHAVRALHLSVQDDGWLVITPDPPTAAQINEARQAAAAADMTIETKNSQPSSHEVINWATVFGIVLALGILAMTVGLIRSETAADLRTLTATGAGSGTRRALTAATAGSLGLLGAVLGTVGGYIAVGSWTRSSTLNGGLSALSSVPKGNLVVILIGMPLAAAVGGWLLAGREPRAMTHQPLE